MVIFLQIKHFPCYGAPRQELLVLRIILHIMWLHANVLKDCALGISLFFSVKRQQSIILRIINQDNIPIPGYCVCIVYFICQHLPGGQRVCQIIMVQNLIMIAVCKIVGISNPGQISCHIQGIVSIIPNHYCFSLP